MSVQGLRNTRYRFKPFLFNSASSRPQSDDIITASNFELLMHVTMTTLEEEIE